MGPSKYQNIKSLYHLMFIYPMSCHVILLSLFFKFFLSFFYFFYFLFFFLSFFFLIFFFIISFILFIFFCTFFILYFELRWIYIFDYKKWSKFKKNIETLGSFTYFIWFCFIHFYSYFHFSFHCIFIKIAFHVFHFYHYIIGSFNHCLSSLQQSSLLLYYSLPPSYSPFAYTLFLFPSFSSVSNFKEKFF